MGWWEDFAHPIGRAATAAVNTVGNMIAAPIEAIGDIAQGRNFAEVLEDKGKKLYGASVNLSTGGWLASTSDSQQILRDSGVSQATLGLSDNFAGFAMVGDKFQTGAEVTQDEWNRAGRFLAQTATLAYAGASGNLGSEIEGTSRLTLQNYAIAQAASPMLARGDVRGLATLAGVQAPIANLLPSNPATPPRATQPTAGPTQAQTPSADYWGSNGGAVGNSFGAFGMSNETLILTAAAVAAGLILTRRL